MHAAVPLVLSSLVLAQGFERAIRGTPPHALRGSAYDSLRGEASSTRPQGASGFLCAVSVTRTALTHALAGGSAPSLRRSRRSALDALAGRAVPDCRTGGGAGPADGASMYGSLFSAAEAAVLKLDALRQEEARAQRDYADAYDQVRRRMAAVGRAAEGRDDKAKKAEGAELASALAALERAEAARAATDAGRGPWRKALQSLRDANEAALKDPEAASRIIAATSKFTEGAGE